MPENEKNSGVKNKIAEAAREAAHAIKIEGGTKPARQARALHRRLEIIREAYRRLVYSHEQITPAYEWLYDNYYILEREGRQVIRALSKCRSLPQSDGEPAVRLHAAALCKAAAGAIDAIAIEQYIEAAQSERCFESCELTAFGLMLRDALIEGAARACSESMPDEQKELLLSDAVKTLNFLTTFDFSEIVERQSRLEQILSQDPSGVYPKMDERSRAVYRTRLAGIAKKRHISEIDAANEALRLAADALTPRERHVGFYIIEQELDKPRSKLRGRVYLTLLWAVPAVISIALGFVFRRFWLPFLVFLPVWEIARPLIDYFILKGVPATFMPRMELDGIIPDEAPTLAVVSTLLTSPQKAEEFAKKLEHFYFANGRGNIIFGMLADLKESPLPEQPEDKAVRAAAIKAVRRLNHKYGGRFCLLLRERRFSATQGGFSGWERKRGAILELVRLIKGRQTSISTVEGDLSHLHEIKYIITLDADTGLVMDTAAEMVSAAMHPLNLPVVEDGTVKHGFGILAPRIGVDLEAAGMTPFSRIMAGCGGVTAYDNAAGDIYQDIFGEGIFAGKGIINADAFYNVLNEALPENAVLSHDILEGCYLRAGFLSDVELTDGFPPRPVPWFDRLHRWIRGDWQNIVYIGGRIPAAKGKRATPFNALSRFKLIDNLRRSLTPVLSLLCLIAAAFAAFPVSLLLVIASVLSLAGAGLWSAALAVAHGGPSMLSRKYHCHVLPQAANSVAQGIMSCLFLPHHAFVAADAAIRALHRRHTGKKLLEWVTAAESEAQRGVRQNAFSNTLRRFWPSLVTGAAFLFAAPQSPAKIAGAFFIITPFVAWLSGKPTPPIHDDLDDDNIERLRSYTAAMWRYYEDYVTEADNFLPPDNMQEAPVNIVAHRTSPTNIGLLLLSTLAARDLALIDTEVMYERVCATVATLEKMEKWNGHLYNWYETNTLRPMKPAYISTVDSGNLLCCLITMREGLLEYRGEHGGICALCDRLDALVNQTDLSVLYNKHRRLFHIGFDAQQNKLSEIYYDLLMSEARMTSYFAVAKRIAPKRHWGALGRTLTKQNGYTGPISWTGTMFEYMMPHLLLPVFEDSMAAEAMRFVIFCQKQRVKGRGLPWGISESGFYSFDAALNYQYEAHGVQKLALKRGMNNECVISPYSTFIALPFDRRAGMKNLRVMEQMGLYGRCGFYEAADFTERRTEGHMAIVKSYMAHHVGMSIVASANTLLDGIMQERFMRDREMRAAADLLREKIPNDAVVFNDVLRREVPAKPGRGVIAREEFDDTSPVTPRARAFSNGEYTMMLTDCGASFSMFRGIDLTRRGTDILRAPAGIFAAASFDGEAICATSAPAYDNSRVIRRRVEFESRGAAYHARTTNYGIDMQACVHGSTPCEARCVELCNYTQHKVNARLLLYFEPVLARAADDAAHPAFSRLFLSAEYRADIKAVVFTRRPRSTEAPVCLAAGLAEMDVEFEFELNRQTLLNRPEGIASLNMAINADFSGHTGAVPDAALAMRISAELPPHGKKSFTLITAAANTPDEAAVRLIEARRLGYHGILHGAARAGGSDGGEMENRLASLVLPQILFPVKDGKTSNETVVKNRLGQNGLWGLGISGDFPLILFNYESEADMERLVPYVKMHRSLRLKGIQADLVITFREGGDYARRQFNVIKECVRSCGCDYLIGARGGIHPVNLAVHPEETRLLLISSACHIATGSLRRPAPEPYKRASLLPTTPAPHNEAGIKTFGGGFTGRAFTIDHNGENPPAPWCHIIANNSFGTLVSDRALGFSWSVNARENKLTPWSNDPVADNRGEMLIARVGGRLFDLCLNARVTYEDGRAVYESEIAGLFFTVTVTVPGSLMAKCIELQIENRGERSMDIETAYYTEPVLGVGPSTRRHIAITRAGSLMLMRNPWSQVKGSAFITALEGPDAFACCREGFLSGQWKDADACVSPDPCAAVIVNRRLPPKRQEKITFVLGFAGSESAAQKTADLIKSSHCDAKNNSVFSGIEISTPDKALDAMINAFLPVQFMSSRIKGRTGFYQCGGAYGFRDQLQDCCAALLFDPQIAKAHIYRCAAHQFKEGDVMHWWHQLPPRDGGSRGVRTRCSDDLLWLPYTVCEYLEKTGDYTLFDHNVRYLEGAELEQSEEDRYFTPACSAESENVYLHCVRAVDRAMTQGAHGLPLFGCGDWNDGMNLVGIGGKGESVWLAMFLSHVLTRFAPICVRMGDEARAARYNEEAARLKEAVDETCWNGEWYARGFFDDGSPLGVRECEECRIDLLPQSFAAIAGMPDDTRRSTALDSVMHMLVDERLRLVRLFDPPFDHGRLNPGYIRSYAPGIRENGGQYTHAAVWAALALIIEKRPDEAMRLLSYLNPAKRADGRESAETYRLEPYAMAADIYTNPAMPGRGGWSLYTGAAGWYYRTVIEYLLGIKIRGERIELSPCLPSDWPAFKARLRLGGSDIFVSVKKGDKKILIVDGKEAEFIPLDGENHVAELILT